LLRVDTALARVRLRVLPTVCVKFI
jgi:hypothetical protein